jgi:hypothetical protein
MGLWWVKGWTLHWRLEWHAFMSDYETKPTLCEKFINKRKCIHTNDRLENGLMYSIELPNLMR